MGRKVAIYARVSTEHEAQLSALENQVQYYDNILLLHPDWELYDKYIDEGITGTSVKKRRNFMRMLQDAEAGKFDLIVTREVSRFARNTVDTLQETRKLKKMGVEVYFTEDNIWTFNDEDGELKLTIMATLAQNESKKTSQRVKAGQMISFQNGVFYGTGNIMGYDRVGKDAVINEEQAEVVRLIFKLFLDGMGTQKIKYELEKRGIPTSTGLKTWSFGTISRMLQNPFYCGTVIYRKAYVPDYLEQKPKKNNGEVEQVIVEGKHQPIISKEDFEKVQKLIQSHSVFKKDSKKKQVVGASKDIWSKKLVCECGSQMNRRVYSRNATTVNYGYVCYRQKNEGSGRKRTTLGLDPEGFCNIAVLQEWKLELMASMIFSKILSDKARLKKLAFNMIDKVMQDTNIDLSANSEILVLKEKMKENNTKKDRLLNTYVEGFISKEQYVKKLAELDENDEKLNKRIEELEVKDENSNIDIKYKIKKMKEQIAMKLDYDMYSLSDGMVETFVDKIIVHDDRFEWKLNCISDISKFMDTGNELGKHYARIVITVDDIRRFNKKSNQLKKVFQKEPIIVDIFI